MSETTETIMERARTVLEEEQKRAMQNLQVTIKASDLEALLNTIATGPKKVYLQMPKSTKKPSLRSFGKPSDVSHRFRHAFLEVMQQVATDNKTWEEARQDHALPGISNKWLANNLGPHVTEFLNTPIGEPRREYVKKWFGIDIPVNT